MREILFRGKRCDNGEWVDGFLLKECNYATCSWNLAIEYKTDRFGKFAYDVAEIATETVGQFTGLTDKNGKKIFEGDIVKGRHWTSLNDKKPEDFHLWCVDWSEKSGLITFVDSPTTTARMSIHDFADFGEAEVVGNIYDNPELLGGTVNENL